MDVKKKLVFGERTKIKMTNRKWFEQAVKEMTNEGLSDMIGCPCGWICDNNDSICDGDCQKAWIKWFNKERVNPMPELKDGMFVEIDGNGLGVVLSGNVVLKNGLYGTITAGLKSEVSKIYDTVCFNLCDKSTCIWSKE